MSSKITNKSVKKTKYRNRNKESLILEIEYLNTQVNVIDSAKIKNLEEQCTQYRSTISHLTEIIEQNNIECSMFCERQYSYEHSSLCDYLYSLSSQFDVINKNHLDEIENIKKIIQHTYSECAVFRNALSKKITMDTIPHKITQECESCTCCDEFKSYYESQFDDYKKLCEHRLDEFVSQYNLQLSDYKKYCENQQILLESKYKEYCDNQQVTLERKYKMELEHITSLHEKREHFAHTQYDICAGELEQLTKKYNSLFENNALTTTQLSQLSRKFDEYKKLYGPHNFAIF